MLWRWRLACVGYLTKAKQALCNGGGGRSRSKRGRFVVNQRYHARTKIMKRRAGLKRRPVGLMKRPAAVATAEGRLSNSRHLAESATVVADSLSPTETTIAAADMFTVQRQSSRRRADLSEVVPSTIFGGVRLMDQQTCDFLYGLLRDFISFMQGEMSSPGHRWVVDFGTLLAVVREKRGFIAHDYDVDVGVILEPDQRYLFTEVFCP